MLIVSVIAFSACFEDVYETPDNRLTWFPDHDDTFIISPSIFFFIMGITDLQQ